jgi:hypothetical protein
VSQRVPLLKIRTSSTETVFAPDSNSSRSKKFHFASDGAICFICLKIFGVVGREKEERL